MSEFPDYLDVDYTGGEGESPEDYPSLQHKIEKAIEVTRTGLEEYENPAIMWTGGKDSTLTLYFVKEVAEKHGLEMPPAVFLDHYQHFDELIDFVEHWADEWDLDVHFARNEDIGAYVEEHDLTPGDEIEISELNEQNRHHIRNILEYEEDTFPFLLDTYVGNHLLKTVPLNNAIEELDIDGIVSGVRWDEQEARADETFFSPRHDPEIYPPHDRIQPILQFDERAVWDCFWHYVVPDTVEAYPEEGYVPDDADDLPNGLTQDDIPVSPKYFAGFRSLGSEVSTEKSEDEPAWHQDLENTTERAGRAQDKEDLMERLRDLGYM
ncbi:phosphoadenosine phosphosulfate reductase family protein [Halolamina salifodinae]|uniref:Phosphoadenosine phosphosulfate reductase n=1 Tax=Halolamina salifodinae TaxID=1202767 RepID=A0A8T4H0I3_9EURY|nr:phosphoadenosine phosphosulfate reductase family protein [Halolamina salifodinae]MBP1987095.1 phosphoadenosine phosphosulfate reductase [Halolamina salifodinae]